jgi:protein-tyrosine phosphatase
VTALRPDAADRTFVLGEFGRLLAAVDTAVLPSTSDIHGRGVALVQAVAKLRGDTRPCHRTTSTTRGAAATRSSAVVADEIQATVTPLAAALRGN